MAEMRMTISENHITQMIDEFRKVVVSDVVLDNEESGIACDTAMRFMIAAGLSKDATSVVESVWEEYEMNPEQIEREYVMSLEELESSCGCCCDKE